MPVPGTSAAKGYTMCGPEFGTSVGLYQLLTDTAVSSLPVSLTNAIPGAATNGMRLIIFAYNHTATGTISIAGTAPLSGGTVNETSTSFTVAEWPGEMIAYGTTNVFGTVNASGVTLGSGLTGGRIQIFGYQAATRLLPGDVKIHDKYKEYSPIDQRGVYDQDFHLVPLQEAPEWEYAADLYPDSAMGLLFQGGYNASPTTTTLPASPAAILTSTSMTSGGNASAAVQPTAPGMILQCVVGGTPGTAGTVTITGTNVYGEPYSETIVPSSKTAATYTSLGVFATINANGIVWTAFGTGTPTLTVNGYFGFQQGGNPGDTLQSFVLEQYDSEGSFAAGYALVSEWSLEFGMDKECKVTAKGPCQYVATIGNPSTQTSQITALTQAQDRPITGWEAVCWIDSISGTAGTTGQLDIVDGKLTGKIDWVVKYTSWGNPVPLRRWGRAYRKRRSVEGELTVDMTPTTFLNEYQAFKQRRKRQLRIQLKGYPSLDAGANHYLGPQFDLPIRYIDVIERDFTPGKESVEVKLKFKVEYDVALGYGHKITWNTRFQQW